MRADRSCQKEEAGVGFKVWDAWTIYKFPRISFIFIIYVKGNKSRPCVSNFLTLIFFSQENRCEQFSYVINDVIAK